VLRDRATMTPGHSVWGLFDPDGRLVSCAVAAIVEDTLVGWWMATRPSERRRGYGGLLVNSLLADAAANGVRCALHHSSYVGEPTYRALGFEELERLQLWSRRRWFLSRA
jgi:GNAT superfamily N-acetyltransferase